MRKIILLVALFIVSIGVWVFFLDPPSATLLAEVPQDSGTVSAQPPNDSEQLSGGSVQGALERKSAAAPAGLEDVLDTAPTASEPDLAWTVSIVDASTGVHLTSTMVLENQASVQQGLSSKNTWVGPGALGLNPERKANLTAQGDSPLRVEKDGERETMWAKAPGYSWKSFSLDPNTAEVEVRLHQSGGLELSIQRPDSLVTWYDVTLKTAAGEARALVPANEVYPFSDLPVGPVDLNVTSRPEIGGGREVHAETVTVEAGSIRSIVVQDSAKLETLSACIVRVICREQDRPVSPWMIYWTPSALDVQPGIPNRIAPLRDWTAYEEAGASDALVSESYFYDVASAVHLFELAPFGVKKEVHVSEAKTYVVEFDMRELTTIELVPVGEEQELINSSRIPITWSYAEDAISSSAITHTPYAFVEGSSLKVQVLPRPIRIHSFAWPWTCEDEILDVKPEGAHLYEVYLSRADVTVVRLFFMQDGSPINVGDEVADYIEMVPVGSSSGGVKQTQRCEDPSEGKGIEFWLDAPGQFQVTYHGEKLGGVLTVDDSPEVFRLELSMQ